MSDILGIVLDAGSLYTKAGIAGEAVPRAVLPTAVGRSRYNENVFCFPIYCGHEAIQNRGISELTWPVQEGMIDNWEEVEKLWHHMFYLALHVPPERSKVLHVVHPLTPMTHKERITEILFEVFAVDSLYLAISTSMVLHASGRTTGVVWENGHSCCYASPVFEGFPLKHATVCSPLTGKALSDHFSKLLTDTGYSFTTPMEKDLLDRMKADICYVAQDYEEELKNKAYGDDSKVKYTLPDGQHVLLRQECFKCPEVLFQPSLGGFECPSIVDIIGSTIDKCDLDYKRIFYENMVVSGGSSMYPGLVNRLKAELTSKLRFTPGIRANVDELSTRQFAPWAGGSIIASLSSLKNFWMTKEEYEDSGPDRVKYKFY